MAPPSYSELGRPASALFTKSYPLGVFKLDGYIQGQGNATITSAAAMKLNEWTFDSAEINTSYTLNPSWLNTTVSQSWDLDNQLKLGVTTNDVAGYVPGLRLTAQGTVDPESGNCWGKISPKFKSKYATLDMNIEGGDDKKSMATGSIVAGFSGWLAGAKGNYNMDEGSFATTSLAVGKQSKSYEVHGFWEDFEKARASIYHRINDRVEAAVTMSWKGGNPPGEDGPVGPSSETETEIAIGARMLLTPFTSLQTKVNTDSKIGVSVESEIRSGVVLTLAAGLDGKNLQEGKHQIGLGLDFDAC